MNTEPTAQDLATKLGTRIEPTTKPTMSAEQRAAGVKAIKQTERNGLCPCGCGQKAKKCQNGRRVLEFKRYMKP